MLDLFSWMAPRLTRRQEGAIGWLILGIVLGVLLVIFGIIKFLIPGE